MLQAIRERAQGVLAWVIILLIAIPFAFWGIQNYFDIGQETPVALVGDKEFFQRDVNLAYQQIAQNPILASQFSEEELQQQALEQLVDDEVIAQVSSDLGLVVSDQTIRDFNTSLPYFQTDGKFDKNKYKLVLSSQGLSSAGFAEKVRRTLVTGQYRSGIVNSDFATQSEVNRIFDLQNQEREIDYLLVPLQAVKLTINGSSVSKYYQENQDLYQTAEQVSVDYIELSLEDLATSVMVSEKKLLDLYNTSKDLYTTQERRKASHILIALDREAGQQAVAAARDKAQKLRQRIKAGEAFATLAKELSDDKVSAKQGGDLGLITPGVMEKNFEEAVLSLAKGEISAPVKTAFGYHLIKITELSLAETREFEQVRDEVSKHYRRNQAENQFYELGERLAELSYEDPGSLEPAAQALNVEINHTDLFSLDSGEGIAAEQKIRKIAFSDDVVAGNNSEPVELGDDKVIVLRVKEHLLATIRPLEEVREEIVKRLKLDAAKAKAKEIANEIYTKLEQGSALTDLAQQHKLSVTQSKIVTRNQNELSTVMQQAIFKAPKPSDGNPIPLLVETENGEQAIINVVSVRTPASEENREQIRQAVEKRLVRFSGQSLYSTLVSQTRDQVVVRFIAPEQ